MEETSHLQNEAMIQDHLRQQDYPSLRKVLEQMADADIGEVCNTLALDDIILVLRMVKRHRRPDLFSYFPIDLQESLLNELSEVIVGSIIDDMEADDRTKLLEKLEPEIRDKVLLKLSPEQRKIAGQLLSYPEDSVGRLMNTDFLALRKNMTVSEALSFIRWKYSHQDSSLERIFVTDKDGSYLGQLSPARLITTDPPSRLIDEVMDTDANTLVANDDKVKAVDYFRKYDLNSFPVTDEKGKLLGYVTADDMFDVAEEEASEDLAQFGGQANLEESYFKTPILTLLRKRGGWLSILFFGEMLTGTALKHYDSVIASLGFLVFFIPLIISSGGNSGSQAASLIIRGMAMREMSNRDWLRVFLRELVTGTGLGFILGAIGYVRVLMWGYEWHIAMIVSVTLIGVVTFGGLIGAMLPFIFKKFNFDPAVSSSPFIASLVDVTGIVIYVNVALIIFHFLDLPIPTPPIPK